MDTTIPMTDGRLVRRDQRVLDDGAAGISLVHAENPEQRAVLLAALSAGKTSPSGIAPIVGTFTAVAPNQYLTGTAASTGISAALPASVGRAVWAMVEANSADGSAPGTVTGTYVVQKSTNGGGKWRPLTVGGGAWATFSAYAYEPISSEDDAGSLYRIVCITAPTSGTITYRLGHS